MERRYHEGVILRLAALTLFALSVFAQETAPHVSPAVPRPIDLPQVKTVYVVTMSFGFDHFLANQIGNSGLFQVVTDPALADAVLVEGLGPETERRLKELYPVAEVEPPPADESKEQEGKTGESGISLKPDLTVRKSTFSSGKGNIFLVDPRAKAVIWSTFIRRRNSLADELNRAAGSVADRLRDTVQKLSAAPSR